MMHFPEKHRRRIREGPFASWGVALFWLLSSGGLGWVKISAATEVDAFTGRDQSLADADELLDHKVNQILDRAARQANREAPGECSRMLLRQEIVRWVGPDPVSLLELWATSTSEIQRLEVSFAGSVYQDASFLESPGMRVFGIGRVFRLADHWVGTDKLGHFFMQGLDYFKRVHEEGQSLAQVLEFAHGEDGLWGRAATGVRSYADMAANAAGYRFWASLYRGPRAYMRCDEGKGWVKIRAFAWRDYVSDAWDEGINCSEMSEGLQRKFDARLGGLGLRCPVDFGRCQKLALLEDARFVVNPKCRAAYVFPNFSKE